MANIIGENNDGSIERVTAEMVAKGTRVASNDDGTSSLSASGSDIVNGTSSSSTWKTWMGYETSYDKKMTIKHIGSFLSERMNDTIKRYNGDKEIGNGSSPLIAFPGGTNLYKNKVAPFDNLFSGDYKPDGSSKHDDGWDLLNSIPSEIKNMYGNPGNMNLVNVDAPGLAMGEASVLNPDFQFNELDDVRSDFRRPKIGRLYSERIYDYNLPKVFFEVGTVSINMSLITGLTAAWFGNEDGKNLSEYLRDPNKNLIRKAFQKLGSAVATAASFVSGGILRKKKMYKFTSTSKVYMQYVNEILLEIASWMGLGTMPIDSSTYSETVDMMNSDDTSSGDTGNPDAVDATETSLENIKSGVGINTTNGIIGSSSYAGKCASLSVYNILPQFKKNSSSSSDTTSDNSVYENSDSDFNITDLFQRAQLFIPFALQKGVSVSETFSNSTQEHPVVSTINSTGQNNQQQLMIGQVPSDSLGGIDSVIATAKDSKSAKGFAESVFSNMISSAGAAAGNKLKDFMSGKMGGELGMAQSGNSRFSLPEIWTDSTFDRNYNLTFKFRSPYGNKLAIFENTIIQPIFLIAMASARQVGKSSYTNPFYIKAFSKSLFSTELGMISSLSITRGEDRNDRTCDGFARNVTVSMSIKDMVPKLAMSLDAGIWGVLGAHNSGFRDYITFVAGVDLMDRIALSNQLKTFFDVLKNKWSLDNFKNNVRFAFAQSLPAKLMSSPRSIFYNKETNKDLKSSITKPSSF